jgi:hypothetical protein
MTAREVPMLRALLSRFDDQDSVLFLTVHHSVSDAWSVQVIMRDLGAFYAARRSGIPAKLPEVRQYREYSEWQRASASNAADDGAPKYWLEKLHGAREFTIPNDHCTSFRDIVAHTRETLVDAVGYELPLNVIEQTFPDFIKSRDDLRTSQFIISDSVSQFRDPTLPIGEGAHEVNERLLQEPVHHDIPSGMVWNLSVEPSGSLCGSVLFNLDEFDESTIAGWAADLLRVLTSAVSEPDRDWKLL